MKWLRIILPIFLIMGMLLCINSVAYADPGDEDSGLNVEVIVVGDGSDVGVDLYGDDNTANVNFHSENPTVWINGQNLNQPTAVYNVQNGGGASSMGVRRVVKDVMFPYVEDIWAGLNWTVDGLAKVIQMAQAHDSELGSQVLTLNRHDARLIHLEGSASYLEDRASYLEGRLAALELKEGEDYAAVVELVSEMEQGYNRNLITIIGAFSLVVIGLGAGLFLLWRRSRI